MTVIGVSLNMVLVVGFLLVPFGTIQRSSAVD